MFKQYLSAAQRTMRHVHKVLFVRSTGDGINFLQNYLRWGGRGNPEEQGWGGEGRER